MHSRSASRMRLVILGLLALVLLLPQFSRQAFATEGSNLVTSSAANDWQIVSGGYQGNGTSAKETSDDGAVKMQKNVVPTDVENEFLVYVSIDKTASMKELLDQGTFYITTSNSYHKYQPGTMYPEGSIHGNSGTVNPHGDGGRNYQVTIRVHQSVGSPVIYTYKDLRSGTVPNCNNATGFMSLPGMSGWVIASQSVSLQGDELSFDVYLDKVDLRYRYEVNLDSFVDTMGENIDFLGVQYADGTSSFDESSKTLTWNPTMKSGATAEFTANPFQGWYHNVSELVYKVRLNVSSDSFVSGGTPAFRSNSNLANEMLNNVNSSATLNYTKKDLYGKEPDTKASMAPKSPVVRGLLYDFEFTKQDENGKPLPGATFQLTDASGNPVKGSDGNLITATSFSDGSVKFRNLPWGTYGAKETAAPAGYRIDPSTSTIPSATLCWTTSKSTLTEDHSGKHQADLSTDVDNACPSRDYPVVTNLPNLALNIYKYALTGEAKTSLSGAKFTVRRIDGTTTLYTDKDCSQELGDGSVTTDDDGNAFIYGLGAGEYEIEEVWVPTGYSKLQEPLRLKIERTDGSGATAPEFTASFYNKETDKWVPATVENGVIKSGLADVRNNPIGELPSTGGFGTMAFTVAALCCVGVAIACAWRLCRCRK